MRTVNSNQTSFTKNIINKLNTDNSNKLKTAIREMVTKKLVEREEYEISFNFGLAVKMFIYHILFFFLGIFGTAIILMIEGYELTKNMGFIGNHWLFLIVQYSTHTFLLSYIVVFHVLPMKSVTYYEISFLIYTIIARCFIIAARYGFISSTRYQLYKSKVNFNWISSDFLLFGWLKMSPKSLKEQIEASKYRLQIYEKDWNFSFVECLPKDLSNRLQEDNYV